MSEYKTKFSDSELEGALGKHKAKADDLLKDPRKMSAFIKKVKDFLRKAENIPVIGVLVNEIITMIEMFEDYSTGVYRDIPLRVMVSMVASILYLLSPVDLIPDVIPVIGYLDDVAVISLVISLGAGAELSKYRKWREQRDVDDLEKIIEDYEAEIGNNSGSEGAEEDE